MKKTKVIKITIETDYVTLTVDGKVNSRWPIFSRPEKEHLQRVTGATNEAKIHAFYVAWQITETDGSKVEINPYIN